MKRIASLVVLSLCPGLVLAQAASSAAPAAAAPAPAAAASPAAPPSFEASALDRSVDPCVDFYKFACGTWMANNPTPGDKSRWGRFDELAEMTRGTLHEILEAAAKPDPGRDPVKQKVGDYYASCMDEKTIEAAGAKPLLAEFKKIDAIKSRGELIDHVAYLFRQGVGALFGFGVGPDFHDASIQIAHLVDGGITLPDRDYYLKDDAKSKETREKYVAHITEMLGLAGETPEAAAAAAKSVLAVETELAKSNMDRVLRRDPKNRDHKMTVADAAKLAPNFELERFFAATGAPKFKDLNVGNPDFFKTINGTLETVPLGEWKTYLRWKVLLNMVDALPEAFLKADFEFWGKYLRGQKEMEVRWKRCTKFTDESLGEALGQLYVAKAFGGNAKPRTLELVAAIEKAMGEDLKSLDWMTDETKAKAAEKLAKVTNKIGYPDKWRDYGTVKVTRDDFVGNARRASAFEVARRLKKIGQPVDKAEWGMSPPTVNAYYSPPQNNINFPAGILQGAFFGADRDDAVNLGAIGAVIGHELTHGFDDQGSKFDGNGNLTNWWTDKDRAAFDERTGCLAAQYGEYSPVEGVKLNGKLTLGENTADNGGVKLAAMALADIMKAQPGRVKADIGGFSPMQRFFLGFAQIWCQNVTPETSRVLAQTDPHSPGEFRVIGVAVNSAEFATAFSCKAGQPMVSAKPCRAW